MVNATQLFFPVSVTLLHFFLSPPWLHSPKLVSWFVAPLWSLFARTAAIIQKGQEEPIQLVWIFLLIADVLLVSGLAEFGRILQECLQDNSDLKGIWFKAKSKGTFFYSQNCCKSSTTTWGPPAAVVSHYVLISMWIVKYNSNNVSDTEYCD